MFEVLALLNETTETTELVLLMLMTDYLSNDLALKCLFFHPLCLNSFWSDVNRHIGPSKQCGPRSDC